MDIILILIAGIIFIAFSYLCSKDESRCPKCGKQGFEAGNIVRSCDGKKVKGYKCSCGEFWWDDCTD